MNLTLTIVDTPGFGDAVDNSNCWEPVINYVESQYESFLDAETRVNRVSLPDTRVHVCLYFIAPSGHGLKPLDVEYMQRLHDKVRQTNMRTDRRRRQKNTAYSSSAVLINGWDHNLCIKQIEICFIIKLASNADYKKYPGTFNFCKVFFFFLVNRLLNSLFSSFYAFNVCCVLITCVFWGLYAGSCALLVYHALLFCIAYFCGKAVLDYSLRKAVI